MIVLWVLGAVLVVGVAVVCHARLRRAFVDGWRCVARHPALWRIPACFAAAYGLFSIAAACIVQWRMSGHLPPALALGTEPLSEPAIVRGSLLPACEQVAALLNCLPAPFPLSALAALIFLGNGFSSATALRRALRRRAGRWGVVIFLLLLLSALAALARPVYMLALPELSMRIPWPELLPLLTGLNALAFAFDYLFASGVQVFLILTAWSWVRGMQFARRRLIGFAARRLGSLILWPLTVIGATLVLVHLPLLVQALAFSEMNWQPDILARPAWVMILLVFPTMLIELILRHRSLIDAARTNLAFLRRQGGSYFIFLAAAFTLALLLHALGQGGLAFLGDALLGQCWLAGCQVLAAAVAGWLLAVWVCLYTSPREAGF